MVKFLSNNTHGWVTIHWGYQTWQGLAREIPEIYLDLLFSTNTKH